MTAKTSDPASPGSTGPVVVDVDPDGEVTVPAELDAVEVPVVLAPEDVAADADPEAEPDPDPASEEDPPPPAPSSPHPTTSKNAVTHRIGPIIPRRLQQSPADLRRADGNSV